MRTCLLVIVLERFALLFKIRACPEKYVVQEFSTNRADQPVHERMGQWYVRHRLDFLNLENPEIGLPTMNLNSGS